MSASDSDSCGLNKPRRLSPAGSQIRSGLSRPHFSDKRKVMSFREEKPRSPGRKCVSFSQSPGRGPRMPAAAWAEGAAQGPRQQDVGAPAHSQPPAAGAKHTLGGREGNRPGGAGQTGSGLTRPLDPPDPTGPGTRREAAAGRSPLHRTARCCEGWGWGSAAIQMV